jgi:hypothetical protein
MPNGLLVTSASCGDTFTLVLAKSSSSSSAAAASAASAASASASASFVQAPSGESIDSRHVDIDVHNQKKFIFVQRLVLWPRLTRRAGQAPFAAILHTTLNP